MKKITKKIFALALAAIIGCTSFAVVAAEETSVNVPVITPDPTENSITVSGTIQEATVANSTLIMYIYHTETVEGTEVTVDDHMGYTQTYKDASGKIAYTFPEIFLPTTFASDTYTIEITGEDLNAPIKYDYDYKSDKDKLKYIKELKTAAEDTSATKNDVLFTAFADNYGKLGISVDGLDTIGADASGKLAFVTILRDDVDYGTPPADNADLDDIVPYNITVIQNLIDASFDAEAAAKFVMIKTVGDALSWYDAYYSALDFDDEAVDTGKVTKYVKDVKGTADFAERLAKAQAPITIDEIREYIYESAVLATIADETKTVTEIEDLIFEYDETGEYFDDVKTTAYNRLDGDIQAKVFDEFIHVSYEDCEEAVETLNDLIDYDWSEDSGSGSSSSSNKGGSRGTVSLPNSLVAENNAATDEKGFTDLAGFEWAEEAIADLAERGIVNGKADGIYAPNDNVTRAEFIKMVISAMGVDLGGAENAFADVAQDAWYAPYVAAAYRNAIVLGDENGNFYPEAPITREDMVTILYRVVDAEEGVGRVEKFTDAAQVSDYAKDAVGYFASKNIVTGMGDGSFAPKNNATRAETAVIIYRIITNLK